MGAATRANVGGPSEHWKTKTRAHLIATIELEGMGATARSQDKTVRLPKNLRYATARPGGNRIRARGAILVGLAVGTLALSGMSAASGSAMPGDTLYGIKRSQESAQLALATSDGAKGKLYLEFATTRLTEASRISGDDHLFMTAMSDLDHQVQLGASLLATDAVAQRSQASLNQIKSFVTTADARLDALMNQIRSRSDELTRTQKSRVNVDIAGVRAAAIQNALACKAIVVVSTDEWGPKPAEACQTAAPLPGDTLVTPQRTSTAATKRAPNLNGKATTTPAYGNASDPAVTTPDGGQPAMVAATDTATTTDAAGTTDTGQSGSTGLLGDISHLLGGLIGH
jgi:hypothetical protein